MSTSEGGNTIESTPAHVEHSAGETESQDHHVRAMVSSLGEKAASWYEHTKEASPSMMKERLDVIEDRLRFLREPIMTQWQNIGDPCISRADDALSRAILSPARAVEGHVQWAHTASRELLHQQIDTVNQRFDSVRNNPIVSWITFRDPPLSPTSNSSSSDHERDMATTSASIYDRLDKLKQLVINRIKLYQNFVQKSPLYSEKQRVGFLGVISDFYSRSLQAIESFRAHLAEGGSSPDSSRWRGWAPSSTALVKPLVNQFSPSISGLHNRVVDMLNQIRHMLGLPVEHDVLDETESLSTESDASERNNIPRFNPLAAEFVPVSPSTPTRVASPPVPHNHGISVAGMGVFGLSPEHAALCERAVSILKEMLRERQGTPLKQPGLSRKLYSRHPELKEAIEAAHGLRAFVKRFPDDFRLFPGKGTVWFVTLRDAPLEGDSQGEEEGRGEAVPTTE